jgi:hypothetical protein
MKITGHIDNLTEADFDRLRKAGGGARYEVVLDYCDGDHHELEAHFRLVEEHPTQQIQEPVIRVEGSPQLPPGNYTGRVTRLHMLPGMNRPEVTLALRDDVPGDSWDTQDEIRSEDVVTSYEHGHPVFRLKGYGRQLTDEELIRLAVRERQEFGARTITVGGLEDHGPRFELPLSREDSAAELFMARAADLLAAMIGLMKISPLVLGIPSGDAPLSARIYEHLTGNDLAGEHFREVHMGKHGDGKGADTKNPPSKGGGSHEKGGKGK